MHEPVKPLLVRGAEPVTPRSQVQFLPPALNTLDSKAEYLGDIEKTTGRYRQGVFALVAQFGGALG